MPFSGNFTSSQQSSHTIILSRDVTFQAGSPEMTHFLTRCLGDFPLCKFSNVHRHHIPWGILRSLSRSAFYWNTWKYSPFHKLINFHVQYHQLARAYIVLGIFTWFHSCRIAFTYALSNCPSLSHNSSWIEWPCVFASTSICFSTISLLPKNNSETWCRNLQIKLDISCSEKEDEVNPVWDETIA